MVDTQVSSRNDSSVSSGQAHQTRRAGRRSQGVWECPELPPGRHPAVVVGTGLGYGDCEVDSHTWRLLKSVLGIHTAWVGDGGGIELRKKLNCDADQTQASCEGRSRWEMAAHGEGG